MNPAQIWTANGLNARWTVAVFGIFFAVAITTSGCSGQSTVADEADGEPLVLDGTVASDALAVDGMEGTCPAVPCSPGMICHQGTCLEDHGPCAKGDVCLDDTHCLDGRCVPFGPDTMTFDEACKRVAFEPEALESPVLKCSWDKAGVRKGVIVIDLDGDARPEIVFSPNNGHLVAIRGDTCEEVFDVSSDLGYGSVAAADLDGDGTPEIVGVTTKNFVRVFNAQGEALVRSNEAAAGLGEASGGAAIANLDQVGPPEIVYGGMALRFADGALETLYNVPVNGGYRGVFSTVADVDLDGQPEVVAGNKILDGATGADETPEAVKAFPGGHVAVAQFDSTPEPEIVLVTSPSGSPGVVRIFNPLTGDLLLGPHKFGNANGGPPTVADFDGDGRPEVGAAGYVGYAVFDLECEVDPVPAHCHSKGFLWLKDTQDKSSGCTGSSVFDFNGDGRAEAVYRDECWLRAYDGKTGAIRFATTVTSGTKMELPVVADVDNDGHADIVVPSDNYPGANCKAEAELGLAHQGQTQGILVFEDPQNRWMPSRGIWNQHAYHITNINDDGTVPVVEQNSWDAWNNFRQNVQGEVDKWADGMDLTSRIAAEHEPGTDCTEVWVLTAEICNRGPATAPAGLTGTFFTAHPDSEGQEVCTASTLQPLDPGACEKVSCSWDSPPSGPVELWFLADSRGSETECNEQNNLAVAAEIGCNTID